MMLYTTYTAAVQFADARKPRIRRPVNTWFVESTARVSGQAGKRESRVLGLVAQPIAVR